MSTTSPSASHSLANHAFYLWNRRWVAADSLGLHEFIFVKPSKTATITTSCGGKSLKSYWQMLWLDHTRTGRLYFTYTWNYFTSAFLPSPAFLPPTSANAANKVSGNILVVNSTWCLVENDISDWCFPKRKEKSVQHWGNSNFWLQLYNAGSSP